MELLQLKTFLTIAKLGHFTKAASLLGYAQSSVSGQIKSLEEELGTRLFERLGREVTLTEEGKRLLVHAEKVLELAEEAKESVLGSTQPRGTLTIGAPETISIFRLPELLKDYRKRFPNVKLVLKLGSCREILDWLKKNQIDIAYLMDTPLDISGYVSESLCWEPIVLVAGSGHALGDRCLKDMTDLAGEDLILVEEGGCCYRSVFESLLNEDGVHPGSVQEFGSVETIKKCVISGLGITILPAVSVQEEMKEGQLVPLKWQAPDFNIYTQMLYRSDKWLSPALSALISLSRKHIATIDTQR